MRRRPRRGSADSPGEGAGHFPLEGKRVIGRSVEGDRPKLVTVDGAVELSGEAQAAAVSVDGAFKHRGDAQLFADAVEIASLILERESRSVSGHAQAGDARQAIDDFVGDTVAEPILVARAGHIEKWKDRDGADLGAGRASVPPGTGGRERGNGRDGGQDPEPAAAVRARAGQADVGAGKGNGGRAEAHAGGE